jgi:hypothetical protein
VKELEKTLNTPLKYLFLKQLNNARELELKRFRAKGVGSEDSVLDPSAVLQVRKHILTN